MLKFRAQYRFINILVEPKFSHEVMVERLPVQTDVALHRGNLEVSL